MIVFFFIIPMILIAFHYSKLYKNVTDFSIIGTTKRIFLAMMIGSVLFMAMTFVFKFLGLPRLFFILFLCICNVILILWRALYYFCFKILNDTDLINYRILIYGSSLQSEILIERIKREVYQRYKIIGMLVDEKQDMQIKDAAPFPVIGTVDQVLEIIKRQDADIVFISDLSYITSELSTIIQKSSNIMFFIANNAVSKILKRKNYIELFGIPIIEIKELPLNYTVNRFVKRLIDIIFSTFGIIILSPIFIIIPILVKITSKGPIFYVQKRVGKRNVEFNMYKFRTMRATAEDKTGPTLTKKNDSRVTFLGRILRKTSIDELPQLFNVLLGQMSLVGPRPERMYFVNKFKTEIPGYIKRHKVKTGITGWAQANGLRGNTSLKERIKYDLYYIENWSLVLDFKICVKTILEIFIRIQHTNIMWLVHITLIVQHILLSPEYT